MRHLTLTAQQVQIVTLLQSHTTPQSTQALATALHAQDLLAADTTTYVEQVHGRLKTLAGSGVVERHPGRPATWSLSEAGHALDAS